MPSLRAKFLPSEKSISDRSGPTRLFRPLVAERPGGWLGKGCHVIPILNGWVAEMRIANNVGVLGGAPSRGCPHAALFDIHHGKRLPTMYHHSCRGLPPAH